MPVTRFPKWVQIEQPDCLVDDVARVAVVSRLRAVRHFLPLAACDFGDDVEYVHQLRVWCRRSDAAIKTFAPLLSKQRRRQLRARLRAMRRAAGAARDDDVLLERLRREQRVELREMQALIRQVEEHRQQVQRPIVCVYREAQTSAVEKIAKRAFRRRRQRKGPSSETVRSYGARMLREQASEFLATAQQASTDVEMLHELRIASKRLRYSIEIFAAVFSTTLRCDVYPRIVSAQDALGEINDHAVAQLRYQRWLGVLPVGKPAVLLADLILHEAEDLDTARRRFLDRWHAEDAMRIHNELMAITATDT